MGTIWCIHVAEAARVGPNKLKMASFHMFVHPKWSKITFRKTVFHPFVVLKRPLLEALRDSPCAKTRHPRLKIG